VAAAAVNDVPDESSIMTVGKYEGKTLGEILSIDPKYFKFMRSYVKDEAQKVRMERLLAKLEPIAQPPIVAQAAAAAVQPPPPPVFTAPPAPAIPQMAGITAPPMNTPPAVASQDPAREALVQEIKGMLTMTPKFTGRNLVSYTIPLIKQTIGMVDYTEAAIPDLARLRDTLVQKAAEP
jgi:hypothetical protein